MYYRNYNILCTFEINLRMCIVFSVVYLLFAATSLIGTQLVFLGF